MKDLSFCSLKNVELKIETGRNVISGKNGSGELQLLVVFAHSGVAIHHNRGIITQYGFRLDEVERHRDSTEIESRQSGCQVVAVGKTASILT